MAMEEKARLPHSLRLDERQRLSVSGVEEVVSFDEENVTVQTVKGTLNIRGGGLRVDKLEKTSGELTVTGNVKELEYEEAGSGTGFFSRLFR